MPVFEASAAAALPALVRRRLGAGSLGPAGGGTAAARRAQLGRELGEATADRRLEDI